jgi:hypothetical protein
MGVMQRWVHLRPAITHFASGDARPAAKAAI